MNWHKVAKSLADQSGELLAASRSRTSEQLKMMELLQGELLNRLAIALSKGMLDQ